jgi:misacylated tRNA(Ala) deacylase
MQYRGTHSASEKQVRGMTRKLYWEQPYGKEFSAKVLSLEGNKVVLDQTLFYPRGGGVACDTGTINDVPVTETTKAADIITHTLGSPAKFTVGDTVLGRIDWNRRYRLMRMHTAGHLLSSIFFSKANCRITGNQIEVDKSRMDFNLESFDRSMIERFVGEANRLINSDALVKIYFLPREEALKLPELVKLAEVSPPSEAQLRIVEIEGIDKQADGGQHVGRLKEVGELRLVKLENKGKSNRRLYYDLASG